MEIDKLCAAILTKTLLDSMGMHVTEDELVRIYLEILNKIKNEGFDYRNSL